MCLNRGVESEALKNPELSPEKLAMLVALRVKETGGRAILHGGSVRDEIINQLYGTDLEIKDYDLEVFGLPPEKLYEVMEGLALETGLPLKDVGKAYEVLKLGLVDISVPRRDSKTGKGHKGFSVESDPFMSVKEAARRRDLTMNSIGRDPLTGEVFDYYGGIEDIKRGVMRATDEEMFGDDPLRVLRVVQFAGRFGFRPDEQLVQICRRLTADPKVFYSQRLWLITDFLVEHLALNPKEDPIAAFGHLEEQIAALSWESVDELQELTRQKDGLLRQVEIVREALSIGIPQVAELPQARLGEEWRKLLLKSRKPSVGLDVALETGVLHALYPELEALLRTPQDKNWHPEGNVFEHTKLAIDAAAKIVSDEGLLEDDALVIMLAVLLHDLGKPLTTTFEKGRLRSYGHEEAGVSPAEKFLDSVEFGKDIERRVIAMVRNHLRIEELYEERDRITDSAIRRLARDIYPATIKELALVSKADHVGRAISDGSFPEGDWIWERARQLDVLHKRPEYLVKGRELVNQYGMKPGPMVGEAIKVVEEVRHSGLVISKEQAILLLRDRGFIEVADSGGV